MEADRDVVATTSQDDTMTEPRSQSIFLPHRLPNLNDMLAAAKRRHGKWNEYAEMKAVWHQTLAAEIRKAKLRPMPCAHVVFRWHEPDRRRDLDGITAGGKFILDTLVALKILPTDGWKGMKGLRHEFTVSAFPGVHVMLVKE